MNDAYAYPEDEKPENNSDSNLSETDKMRKSLESMFFEDESLISDSAINQLIARGQELKTKRSRIHYEEIRRDKKGNIDSITQYFKGDKYRNIVFNHKSGLAIPQSEYIYRNDKVIINKDYSPRTGRLNQVRHFFHEKKLCFYEKYDDWGELAATGLYSQETLERMVEHDLQAGVPIEHVDDRYDHLPNSLYRHRFDSTGHLLIIQEILERGRLSLRQSIGSVVEEILKPMNKQPGDLTVIAAQQSVIRYDLVEFTSDFKPRWTSLDLTGKIYPLSDEALFLIVQEKILK